MKKILLFLVLILAMCSCSSHHLSYTASKNIKNVSLGMTKKEVVSTMGKHYMPIKLYQSAEGNNEVIAYEASVDERYEMLFVNNTLVSWERLLINKHHHCNDKNAKKAEPAVSGQTP